KFFIARTIFSKYTFILLATCFGGTIGREGATVQIGATIMTLGRKQLSQIQKRTLLTAGAAAGLAAAFNTPLGGIVFLFEELARGITVRRNIVKITAIAVSGVVAVLLTGNNSYYGTVANKYLYYDWKIFIVAILIGVFAALNNYVFSKCIYYSTVAKTSKLNKARKAHPYYNALICGLLVALIGISSSGLSFGNGYVESTAALNGSIHLPEFYYLYKMGGSYLSTMSGIPGGYFATSLAIGNGIGNFIHSIFALANVHQYALLGMVAFLAALTQAPVTSLVMVMQITYTQVFTLPLIVACLTATWLSMLLDKSIYSYQIESYIH
ncbi:MAG: chloride channel protein, partial [Burkholderiales bacterium]|nr:chloride channel protein [Burkholderiales bacterium]